MPATAYTPVAGIHNYVNNTHAAWNIMATVGFALFTQNGGATGHTFKIFTENCPGLAAGTSCQILNNLHISSSHDTKKYVIAHELGHMVMRFCNDERTTVFDSGGTTGDCDGVGGNLELKQFQSAAANEGAAWFYAASVFNRRTDADCEFGRSLDFNEDGVFTNEEEFPSCEGEPATEPWANLDYLGNECTGTLTYRAVRFDYARALWDLIQDAPGGNGQRMTFADVCDQWNQARPDTWDPDGGSANDDPPQRLLDAASTLGFLTEWNNVDNANGIHR
jgi:hypothetical protein